MNENVTIKGCKDGVVVYLRSDVGFEKLKKSLFEVLSNHKDFFGNASIEINIGERRYSQKELKELKQLVEQFSNITLRKITNASEKILEDFDEQVTDNKGSLANKDRSKKNKKPAEEQSVDESLIIRRTVRSGQKINFSGHVVIVGDVNPGAEIIAGEDIIVMGTVRGVVHAGASGNNDASITALRLLPSQMRIGNIICRAPDEEASGSNVPEYAFVSEERIFINSLS